MSRFAALVRLNFTAVLTAFSPGRNKKKAFSGWAALGFMAFLALYISGTYSFLLADALGGESALIWLLPAFMSVFACFFSFFMTVFAAGGLLFGAKDMDFMLALPVSSFQIMLSKLLALYMETLLINIFMMLPMGVAYYIAGGAGGVMFAVRLLFGTLFMPFIPCALSVVLGYVVTAVSARNKGKALLANAMYLLLFAAVLLLSTSVNTVISNIVSDAENLNGAFGGWLLPFGLFARGVCGSFGKLLLFAALSLIPFLIVVWLFSLRYRKTLNRFATQSVRGDYKLGRVGASGAFRALWLRELGRLFGTPIYLFNTCIGTIMLIGGTVFACIKRQSALEMFAPLGFESMLWEMVTGILCFITATICTTGVSISLEGKYLWILKESPVRTAAVFGAKILLNLTMGALPAMICAAVLSAAFGFSAGEGAVTAVLCAIVSLFTAVLGLYLNLQFPKLDADNDTIVVKQSMSSMLGIFVPMGVVGALAALFGFLLAKLLPFYLYCVTAASLLLLVTAILYRYLRTRGEAEFLELS